MTTQIASFSYLKQCILFDFYRHGLSPSGDGRVQYTKLNSCPPKGTSLLFAQRSAESLEEEELLDSSAGRFFISARGIEYVEKQLSIPTSPISNYAALGNKWLSDFQKISPNPDSWKEPDELGAVDQSKLDEIILLLQECLNLLEKSELSQQDQSQAAGQISSAKSMAEIPTPKIGWIKRILTPLAQISEISALIRKALELLA